MREYINDYLTEYMKSGKYPWHMPGHKRRDPEDLWSQIYARDFTEAKDLDDMHEPEAFIGESLDAMKRVYGSEKTYMLVNGSTSGVMTAIHSCCDRGDAIIVARNCHKSVFNAIAMLGLNPYYILPEGMGDILSAVNVKDIEKLVQELTEKGEKIGAVIITSPTYEGVISDIESISQLLRSHGIYLIVDEAQGAHFEFTGEYKPAIRLGADLVIESLHKTMPALTQTALLHVSERAPIEKVERYLQIFQTSSPSYIFMQSMERAVCFGDNNRALYKDYVQSMKKIRDLFSDLKHIELFVPDRDKIYDHDITRLVFVTDPEELTGTELGDRLADEFNQVVEMTAVSYIVCITSVADTLEDYERLHQALKEIDEGLHKVILKETDNNSSSEKSEKRRPVLQIPEKEYMPGEAWNMEKAAVPLLEAAGQVAADFVYAYPPGIPVLVPGERITEEISETIQVMLAAGLKVSGIDNETVSINICREG